MWLQICLQNNCKQSFQDWVIEPGEGGESGAVSGVILSVSEWGIIYSEHWSLITFLAWTGGPDSRHCKLRVWTELTDWLNVFWNSVQTRYNLRWTRLVLLAIFPTSDTGCWGCMQTLRAENLIILWSNIIQMDAKQQQRRFVPLLCDIPPFHPSTPWAPPSAPPLMPVAVTDQPGLSWKYSWHSHYRSIKEEQHRETSQDFTERRRVTAHFLLWTF